MMQTRMHLDRRGAAAAEMALVMPLLLTILLGSVEAGNYFYNEHVLVKAVRDGARYAGRQDFSYYSACSGTPTGTVAAETKELIRTSLRSGGTNRIANINDGNITVTMSCTTTATDDASATENMAGIWRGKASGAPVVTVSATANYTPIIAAAFGFTGAGFKLNASQQTAVMGL
jgi:Flp pilus assembly protein TadG